MKIMTITLLWQIGNILALYYFFWGNVIIFVGYVFCHPEDVNEYENIDKK